jgi:DNA replication protein DnaC
VGTGKTFLSIALGVEACKKGIETRFFRTAALVNRLSEAKKSGTLSVFMKKLAKAELLICDLCGDISYVEQMGGLRLDLSVMARLQ